MPQHMPHHIGIQNTKDKKDSLLIALSPNVIDPFGSSFQPPNHESERFDDPSKHHQVKPIAQAKDATVFRQQKMASNTDDAIEICQENILIGNHSSSSTNGTSTIG
jgi:hypothetical protein